MDCTFTQGLKYLYFTWVFLFYATLYFILYIIVKRAIFQHLLLVIYMLSGTLLK